MGRIFSTEGIKITQFNRSRALLMVQHSEKILCLGTHLFPYSTVSVNLYLPFLDILSLSLPKQYDDMIFKM